MKYLKIQLSRLSQLKSEILHFRNFSNNKSFKNAEEEYSKLQKTVFNF